MKVCFNSRRDCDSAMGKSIDRPIMSGKHSRFDHSEAMRIRVGQSEQILFRQALIRDVGGYAYACRPFQEWIKLSTFQHCQFLVQVEGK